VDSRLEVGSWKLEAGSRRLEASGEFYGARIRGSGVWEGAEPHDYDSNSSKSSPFHIIFISSSYHLHIEKLKG
jgi:hypothetical protein